MEQTLQTALPAWFLNTDPVVDGITLSLDEVRVEI